MLRDLLKRSGWLALGAATGRLLPLGTLVYASRHLSSAEFAGTSAGFAWSGVAMSLTGAGLATVMTQRLGRLPAGAARARVFASYARPAIGLSALLSLSVLLAGPVLADHLFTEVLKPRVFAPAALAGFLWSQVALSVAVLNGCHQARSAALVMASCGLLQGLGMAAGMSLSRIADTATLWGLATGSLAACGLALTMVRKAMGAPSWRVLWAGGPEKRPIRNAPGLDVAPVLWNSMAAASVLPRQLRCRRHRGLRRGRQRAPVGAVLRA